MSLFVWLFSFLGWGLAPGEGFPADELPSKRQYTTIGNQANAFRVDVDPRRRVFRVKKWDESYWERTDKDRYVDVAVPWTGYADCFVGRSGTRSDEGNSMLFKLANNTYMYVGHNLYTFRAEEAGGIVAFRSDVGNSSVAYPYALGAKTCYLMLEQRVIRKTEPGVEPYDRYYDNVKASRAMRGVRVIVSEPPWNRKKKKSKGNRKKKNKM